MHWEHCSYVYDTLGETTWQRMDGGYIYGKGMWASSLKHDGTCFHVVFTSNDTGHSYHFTAEKAEGPWVRKEMSGFWYDPGLLFDDGRVYIAHGNCTIRITELTDDLSAKKDGDLDRIAVQDASEGLGWEGSCLLHIGGWYYLFYAGIHDSLHRLHRYSERDADLPGRRDCRLVAGYSAE